MNFDVFDESIGIDGYYRYIQSQAFPNSTETSFEIASYNAIGNIYPKGTVFSRVRWISKERANDFVHGNIDINDFYPPRPHINSIPEGRFNKLNSTTMYLSDHPFVALKECNIKEGDYFLLSYFSLPRRMSFIQIESEKDNLSQIFVNLLRTQDKRFYPLINMVYSNLLKFDAHDGVVYNSVKVDADYVDVNCWGKITSAKNFAIQDERIKNFKLEVSWLMYCNKNLQPVEHAMYVPLSNKKKNKIMTIAYQKNREAYKVSTNKIKKQLFERKAKTNILLAKEDKIMNTEILFKIVSK
ncbi:MULTISPECIES: hypothetical protein [Enterobacteriaceae]|uniref:RES domain-containing protein n=2 Tax=Klebsiella pneumoniae TaxID=573 RepID=A0A486SFA4_KLEPN|nr:hypothetical protein [Klebsiella pneumoniae]EIY5470594.1 hypothetical protein [Klebsiella pneumoniae]MCE0366723.1 hypothetical protein [Klebsiella pneumoniae]MDN0143413.1 hypothetical protein [Klebsiella pneumoniae]PXI65904.1 hypothetical protein DMQ05_10975 [Klebsiella pneumoniae]SWD62438.1 Uncharacterised protein [Klebsiella pneumoniae]